MTRNLTLLAALAVPAVSRAAVPAEVVQGVPGVMSYQGSLVDPATGRKYVDGIYTLDIRLWTSESGTEDCLWGARYSAFVKGGAFTLMLGDPNAKDLTAADGALPTYKRQELWKAMWGASDTDCVRYLGVTPHQNAQGADLTDLTDLAELAPRQLFGSAPFVARAERAQYADGSVEGFRVPGDLTVAKATTFTGGLSAPSTGAQQFGPIRTTAATVRLAGETTPAKTLPSIWTVGSVVNLLAYGQLFVQPSSGDVTFDVSSGRRLNLSGEGAFVSELPRHTIGGSGETRLTGGSVTMQTTGGSISLQENANYLHVKNGTKTTVSAKSATFDLSGTGILSGNPAKLFTSPGSAYLAAYSDGIHGRGKFRWAKNGTEYAPFIRTKVSICISNKSKSGSSDQILGGNSLAEKYRWFVVGRDCWRDHYGDQGAAPAKVWYDASDRRVHLRKHDWYDSELNGTIDLVGVLFSFCD